MNRQEFINRIFRSFMLLILAGGTGLLFYKGKVGRSNNCAASSGCNKCKERKNCSLPEAIKFRENDKG